MSSSKGAALVEGAFLILVLLGALGGTLDLGLARSSATAVTLAARHGARVGSTLYEVKANDDRISAIARSILAGRSALTSITVSNTVPVSMFNMLNRKNQLCDMAFSVTVRAEHRFTFLRLFGFPSVKFSRTNNMRLSNGPICD